jgi:hypothetical protein
MSRDSGQLRAAVLGLLQARTYAREVILQAKIQPSDLQFQVLANLESPMRPPTLVPSEPA